MHEIRTESSIIMNYSFYFSYYFEFWAPSIPFMTFNFAKVSEGLNHFFPPFLKISIGNRTLIKCKYEFDFSMKHVIRIFSIIVALHVNMLTTLSYYANISYKAEFCYSVGFYPFFKALSRHWFFFRYTICCTFNEKVFGYWWEMRLWRKKNETISWISI